MSLMLLLAGSAVAAEVVWIVPPDDPTRRAQLLSMAGADGPGHALRTVPGRGHAFDEERDGAAMDRLDATLREVRPFEQRLDGELLIMGDLDDPIADIEVLRDDHDRERLYAALSYQGFAVERFFHGILDEDERAAPFRSTLDGELLPTPWRDAVALAPDRAITAYEIAEAPQRVAYEQVREHLATVLPSTLALRDRPPGLELRIDGRRVDPGVAGMVRVSPGRHFAHLEQDGRIVARWQGVVGPAQRLELPLAPPDASALQAWVRTLRVQATPPPDALRTDLAALDEEVWLIDAAASRAWVWTPASIRAVDLTPVPKRDSRAPTSGERPERSLHATAGVAVSAGWLATPDFYLQAPLTREPSWSTVNALGGLVSLRAGVERARLRIEAGTDLWWTPGGAHVSRWGGRSSHLRGFPHLAIGLPEARLALGWLTPHHVAAGPRLSLPAGPLEIVGSGTVGLSARSAPSEGTWSAAPVYAASLGLGMRWPHGREPERPAPSPP